jgi:hypothetical protein
MDQQTFGITTAPSYGTTERHTISGPGKGLIIGDGPMHRRKKPVRRLDVAGGHRWN